MDLTAEMSSLNSPATMPRPRPRVDGPGRTGKAGSPCPRGSAFASNWRAPPATAREAPNRFQTACGTPGEKMLHAVRPRTPVRHDQPPARPFPTAPPPCVKKSAASPCPQGHIQFWRSCDSRRFPLIPFSRRSDRGGNPSPHVPARPVPKEPQGSPASSDRAFSSLLKCLGSQARRGIADFLASCVFYLLSTINKVKKNPFLSRIL